MTSVSGRTTDVRSDTAGNVWGFRRVVGDGTVLAAGVNGSRFFAAAHWRDLPPVARERLHLFPVATGASA